MSGEEYVSSLFGHLEDLRGTAVRCLCAIALGCFAAFAAYQPLIEWLTAPYHSSTALTSELLTTSRVVNRQEHDLFFTLPEGVAEVVEVTGGTTEVAPGEYRIPPEGTLVYSAYVASRQELVVLGPLDGMGVALKVALWVGIAGTAPVWVYFCARFAIPGLRKAERRAAVFFLLFSAIFMTLGALFAYYVTIPIANAYLARFNAVIGQNWWTLRNYLDYTFFLVVANAVASQFGVIGLFAVHYGVISAAFLVEKRRVAIVLAFVLGALLTPPDIATQFMMAIPLMVLYEVMIVYARMRERLLRSRLAHVN